MLGPWFRTEMLREKAAVLMLAGNTVHIYIIN